MGEVQINQQALHFQYTSPDGFVAKIIERGCIQVETTAKVLMLIPGSGRTYEPGKYVYKAGGKWYAWTRTLPTHRASAPGEPASSDSGRALAAIGHKLDFTGEAVSGSVSIDVDYSIYFELGTSRMAPRPTLRPALSTLPQAY